MIVFPALNSNFKSRKRTFRCCDNCRIKRRRCDLVQGDGSRQTECVNCRKHGLKCTFNKPHRADPRSKEQNLSPLSLEATYKSAADTPVSQVSLEWLLKTFRFSFHLTYWPPQQAELSRKNARTVVAEWGSDRVMTQDSEVYQEQQTHPRGNSKPLALKSDKTYHYLLLIHAFTLSSPEYEFSPKEVLRLLQIFFLKINSLLPIVDEQLFWLHYNADSYRKTCCNNLLVYAMVLAALGDTLAEPILRRVFLRSKTRSGTGTSKANMHLRRGSSKSGNSVSSDTSGSSGASTTSGTSGISDTTEATDTTVTTSKALSTDKLRPQLTGTGGGGSTSRSSSPGSPTSPADAEYARSVQFFMCEMEAKIRHLLAARADWGYTSKLLALIVHFIMSLHDRPDGLGRDDATHDLCTAISTAYSIGLHLNKTVTFKPTSQDPEISPLYATNLWWSLVVYDRIKATTNNRTPTIRQDEFNVALPLHNHTLLHLVNISQSLEVILYALYRPLGNDPAQDNPHKRLEYSNLDRFEQIEFDLCNQDRALGRPIFRPFPVPIGSESEFEKNRPTYISNQLYFTTRIMNNLLILISQKMRFDLPHIPREIPELVTIKASSNILWYFHQLADDQITVGPLEMWSIAMAMSIFTKARALELLEGVPGPYRQLSTYTVEDFFTEVDKYKRRRWIVNRHLIVCRKFIDVLQDKLRAHGPVPIGPPGHFPPGLEPPGVAPATDFDMSVLQDDDMLGTIQLDQYTSEMFKDIPNVVGMM